MFKILYKIDYCIYMMTSISFSETLYKKQITDQRKDTAKTKLTPRWESDGRWKAFVENISSYLS